MDWSVPEVGNFKAEANIFIFGTEEMQLSIHTKLQLTQVQTLTHGAPTPFVRSYP